MADRGVDSPCRYVGGTEAVAGEQIPAQAPGVLPDLYAGYRPEAVTSDADRLLDYAQGMPGFRAPAAELSSGQARVWHGAAHNPG
jgi:hypothetical protein